MLNDKIKKNQLKKEKKINQAYSSEPFKSELSSQTRNP